MKGRPSDGLTRSAFPEAALSDPNLTALQIKLLLALGLYIDRYGTGHCWPSQSTLAELTGATREGVNKALKELHRMGWITVERERHRRALVYGFDPSVCTRSVNSSSQDEAGRSVNSGSQDEARSVNGETQEPVNPGVHTTTLTDSNPPCGPPPDGGTKGADADRAGTCSPTPCAPAPDAGAGGVEPDQADATAIERLAARQGGGRNERDRSPEAGVWRRCQSGLRKALGDATFQSWIAKLSVASIDAGTVTIVAPTGFVRDHVASSYGDTFREFLAPAVPGFETVIFIAPAKAQPAKEAAHG